PRIVLMLAGPLIAEVAEIGFTLPLATLGNLQKLAELSGQRRVDELARMLAPDARARERHDHEYVTIPQRRDTIRADHVVRSVGRRDQTRYDSAQSWVAGVQTLNFRERAGITDALADAARAIAGSQSSLGDVEFSAGSECQTPRVVKACGYRG